VIPPPDRGSSADPTFSMNRRSTLIRVANDPSNIYLNPRHLVCSSDTQTTPLGSPAFDDAPGSDEGTTEPALQRLKKRHRKTEYQLRVLEEQFLLNPLPNKTVRDELGKKLGLTTRQVQIWFQNRRAKTRQQVVDETEFRRLSQPQSSPDTAPHSPEQASPPETLKRPGSQTKTQPKAKRFKRDDSLDAENVSPLGISNKKERKPGKPVALVLESRDYDLASCLSAQFLFEYKMDETGMEEEDWVNYLVC